MTTSHTPLAALRQASRSAWRLTARRDAERIVVSEIVGNSIGQPFTVIGHGVDAAAAAAASNAALQSDDDVPVVICVASHRPAKNYPNLLRAVAEARATGVKFRVVTFGDGPDLEFHRRLARELGLHDIVSFDLPTPDVLLRIAEADLLVVSSDWEGQPMVIAEALAVGTPVVSTSVGQAASLVNQSVGRVVPPGDHVALGAAIAESLGNSTLRATMRAAALEQGSKWTLADAIDAHLEVYSAVVSEYSTRRWWRRRASQGRVRRR